MALTAALSRAGIKPTRIHTEARVTLEKVGEAFSITRIDLETEAEIPGVDDAAFQNYAKGAKEGCPVSKALAGTEIHLNAKLLNDLVVQNEEREILWKSLRERAENEQLYKVDLPDANIDPALLLLLLGITEMEKDD